MRAVDIGQADGSVGSNKVKDSYSQYDAKLHTTFEAITRPDLEG